METRSFPDALKAILKQRGWSQARLARELDMSEDWVSKSRRGLRDPSIGRVIQLLSGVGWEVVIRPKSPKREKSDPVKRREFHGRVVKLAAGSAAVKATGITFVPSARVPIFRNHEYVTALVDHVTHMRNENGAARLISTVA